MRICWRGINTLQMVDAEGSVRACAWIRDSIVGNIFYNDIPEIMHSKKMQKIIASLAAGDYSICNEQICPYLSNDNMDEILIDISETPDYPEYLSLSYEGNCNYHCTCCSAHQHMDDTRQHDYTEKYSRIEQKLETILPHIRYLSANGTAELFAGPSTLKMLRNWKPLAPIENCKVALETNGSLFTPENWKKIENLGQYNLSVTITVMSFQEDVYQFLSGTRLPISIIENNLKFIRSLREKGIINKFTMVSVMQEANFREMPSLIQRCLTEYKADYVRARQIAPEGPYNRNIDWFFDVRNPLHPYYEQYLRVINHPIFQDPRVLLNSGYLPSNQGAHPGVKFEAISCALDRMLDTPDLLLPHLNSRKIGIFGLSTIARMIVRQYKDRLNLCRIYATWTDCDTYKNIPVTKLSEATPEDIPDTVLVTSYSNFENVSAQIREKLGETVEIINFWDII